MYARIAVAIGLLGASCAAAEKGPLAPQAPSYVYKTVGQRQLRVDVLYPTAWQASDRRPAIVFFSGGGFKNGTTRQFLPQAEYFAQRGLVTIRAEYRDSTRDKATVNTCLEDALSAMRWVRQHAVGLGVDDKRIVASGGSAGGFLASSVATNAELKVPGDDMSVSPVPNAVVLFNPVVDLAAASSTDLTNEQESLNRISPAHHLSRAYPPGVILVGSEDRFLGQVQKFVEDAGKLDVKMEIEVYDGQPHAFFNKDPYTGKTAARADRFLQSLGYLSAEPAVDPPAARALTGLAQDKLSEVDQFMQRQVDDKKIAGGIVAVSYRGKIVSCTPTAKWTSRPRSRCRPIRSSGFTR